MTQGAATLAEYVDHLESQGRVVWIGTSPWVIANRRLTPAAPPHKVEPVSRQDVRAAMRRSGAFEAHWSDRWDVPASLWWHVCCDRKDYDLGVLGKNTRRAVRKGLDACRVSKLDPIWFAHHGYGVYRAAFSHYGTAPLSTEEGFVKTFLNHAKYSGRETWGAFVGEELVAWESCIVIDDAVISASAKTDPQHFKSYASNAIVYTLTRHYLCERQMAYVTCGERNLVHDTNVQGFQEKMGYRKVYSSLAMELAPLPAWALRLRAPTAARLLRLGKLFPKAVKQLEALDQMATAARQSNRSEACPGSSTDHSSVPPDEDAGDASC